MHTPWTMPYSCPRYGPLPDVLLPVLIAPILCLPCLPFVAAAAGAFVGAWGTIIWEFNAPSNDPSRYSFDIYLPKVHKDKDYKESEKQYKYDEDKY